MIRRVLLLRHGRTEWNAQRRFQGQADPPLDDVGRAQAYEVAALVAALRPRADRLLRLAARGADGGPARRGHWPAGAARAAAAGTCLRSLGGAHPGGGSAALSGRVRRLDRRPRCHPARWRDPSPGRLPGLVPCSPSCLPSSSRCSLRTARPRWRCPPTCSGCPSSRMCSARWPTATGRSYGVSTLCLPGNCVRTTPAHPVRSFHALTLKKTHQMPRRERGHGAAVFVPIAMRFYARC